MIQTNQLQGESQHKLWFEAKTYLKIRQKDKFFMRKELQSHDALWMTVKL